MPSGRSRKRPLGQLAGALDGRRARPQEWPSRAQGSRLGSERASAAAAWSPQTRWPSGLEDPEPAARSRGPGER